MNLLHRWLCRSSPWRKLLESKVLPWILKDVDLGAHVLEIGPGPGLATDLLCRKAARVTAIELDLALAKPLAARMRGTNAAIIAGDGAAMPFSEASFSGAISCVMLHHVPSPALQDQMLREARRVLKPGAVFAGMDVCESRLMRAIHVWDTMVPVDPQTFAARLEAAGFENAQIEANAEAFRFSARRPAL